MRWETLKSLKKIILVFVLLGHLSIKQRVASASSDLLMLLLPLSRRITGTDHHIQKSVLYWQQLTLLSGSMYEPGGRTSCFAISVKFNSIMQQVSLAHLFLK